MAARQRSRTTWQTGTPASGTRAGWRRTAIRVAVAAACIAASLLAIGAAGATTQRDAAAAPRAAEAQAAGTTQQAAALLDALRRNAPAWRGVSMATLGVAGGVLAWLALPICRRAGAARALVSGVLGTTVAASVLGRLGSPLLGEITLPGVGAAFVATLATYALSHILTRA